MADNTFGCPLLEERLESLISFRWGYVGLARPRATSFEVERLTRMLPEACAEFTWIVFDDGRSPRAIGIRLVDDPFTNPRYEVSDCDELGALSRSTWRFSAHSGWHRLDVSAII